MSNAPTCDIAYLCSLHQSEPVIGSFPAHANLFDSLPFAAMWERVQTRLVFLRPPFQAPLVTLCQKIWDSEDTGGPTI